MSVSTITSKGQTTIPADIRAFMHVGAGDKIMFIPQENGHVLMVPKTRDVRELYGCLPKPRKRVNLDNVDDAIAKYLAADDERIKKEYND